MKMKRKGWIAVFLTLAMIITTVSPVSARGFGKREDNPRNKYSWEQTKEEPSQAEQENYEQEGSVDESAVEEETSVEETTPAEEEVPVEETTPAEEEVPVEETTPAEEEVPVEETPVYLDGNLTGSDESYKVTVTFNTDAQIPEGSSISVKELSEEDAAYQEAKEYVQLEDEDDQFTALDISIVDAEGNEIEPASAVQVEIEVSELPEGVNEDTEITVSHINESTGAPVVETVADTSDKTEGTVEVNEDAAVVNFTVDSFSTFTLTYAAKSADNADNNEGIESYAWNDLNVGLIDENGGSVGSGTVAISADNTSWTSVDDLAPSISGYNFVGAYRDNNISDNYKVTYIKYWDRVIFDDSWRYSTNQSRPNNTSDGYELSDLYFVYEADDGMVTLAFNNNNGYGDAPETMERAAGTAVTLPEYDGYRYNYEFIGWTTAAVTFPNSTYYAVYAPGSSFTLEDDTTLYAAWQQTNADSTAYFYIRLDGQIPYEPGSYVAADYTNGIQMTNAVTAQNWIVDVDSTKEIVEDGNYVDNNVAAALLKHPSDALIERVCDQKGIDYDPETQYIHWYVQKYQSLGASAITENGQTINTGNLTGWHIDGVLLDRSMITLTYDANVPAGVTNIPNVPQGYQVYSGTEVTVGESGRVGGPDTYKSPSIEGYNFLGWNTEADGTGTMYQPDDTFTMTQNTTLYAIWTKGENMMTLNKVDGLGNSLGGASFIMSYENNEIEFNAGTYTNTTIKTDTVYTIEETAAPENYMGLESEFSFIVSSQGGEDLTAYICDADGDPVADAPAYVELKYNNYVVNITVTNIGYFYIFHTADVSGGTSVVEVPIMPDSGNPNWNEDGTYNIVNETTDGFLYGGYYKDYAGKGNYSDENRDDLTGSETYKGDQTSWDGDQAYTENGMAMTPVAGTTYYLKEVPSTYLRPATYVVYDTIDGNKIKQLYLMTATDDQNYNAVGFDTTLTGIEGKTAEDISGTLYDQVTVNKEGQEGAYDTLSASEVFNLTGYLAISGNKTDYIVKNANYIEKPYWVTLDGVKVTGDQNLKVYLRNTTYKDGWKLPGITKTVQTAVPTVTFVGTGV